LGLVALLVTALVWQAPAFVRSLLEAIGNGLKVIGETLGNIESVSGGLVLILGILAVIVGGIKKRKRIREIVFALWEKLVRS
jgi:uncharacterized BrkB/YihY/UPF0761 family membrane protein